MNSSVATSTHYIPFDSPPTPTPSPGPQQPEQKSIINPDSPPSREREHYLSKLLHSCTPGELLFISKTIAPLLKRDFLRALPPEIAVHILSFVDDPITLLRARCVSRAWRDLVAEESVWKGMCAFYGFGMHVGAVGGGEDESVVVQRESAEVGVEAADSDTLDNWCRPPSFSACHTLPSAYERHFKDCYVRVLNWTYRGRLLRFYRLPMLSSTAQQRAVTYPSSDFFPSTFPDLHATLGAHTLTSAPQAPPQLNPTLLDEGIVTSLALDDEWIAVGLASSRIHIFSAQTGVLARTLVGHNSGVWGICLVSRSKTSSSEKAVGVESRLGGMSINTPTEHPSSTESAGLSHTLTATLRIALGLEQNAPSRYGAGVADGGGQGRRPRTPVGLSESPPSAGSALPSANIPGYVPGRQSDPCFASEGWGQPNALVVSGGCDKVVRVWDVLSGFCIYTLPGHTSTIRCMRTLHGRPLAVTGSRDYTARVWDIQHGRQTRVLAGHEGSIRSLDVNGNRAVTASYDTTCRIWDVDTGECLGILRGHYHQLYCVAFDGVRVASGGLDTTVRIWDPETSTCIALLQGHTGLVCQMQLSREHQLLATGGVDGRVIMFSLDSSEAAHVPSAQPRALGASSLSLSPRSMSSSQSVSPPHANLQPRGAYEPIYRIAAHDMSLTALQFDGRFLVTGGSDGRVRLWETRTGRHLRDLTVSGESVWKVGFTGGMRREAGEWGGGPGDMCAIMLKSSGKTYMEVWSFRPE